MDIKEQKVAGKRNHPWEYARGRVVNSLVKPYLSDNDTQKLVLDVGCGDVFFLSRFHDEFPNSQLIAIDTAFDNEIIDFLKNKYSHYPIDYVKNIDEVGDKKVSVVFLLDVLEHIENASVFLKTLVEKSFIGKDTLFVISVPAYQALFVEHDRWLGHYRRYSRKTLAETVRVAGLQQLSGGRGHFFFSLFLIRALQKVMEFFIKPKTVTGIGSWNGGKIVSSLYENALVLDFRLCHLLNKIGIHLPGLSTYSISKPINPKKL
ncbi:MAG: class I SAM-dependent methyltransferase [Bacteroidales bacterium]|jgi:SAM-dependent methyltransferase|nr:class I SAM-dependent methyltransferase [Bacteroidales bacterium]